MKPQEPKHERPRQPGKIRSVLLALAVHGAFFALIVFGVTWQSRPTPPLQAELWDKLPPGPPAAARKAAPEPPPPEPAPPKADPKPEPPKAEPRPGPPKPEAKPEPPRPDPAIAEKKYQSIIHPYGNPDSLIISYAHKKVTARNGNTLGTTRFELDWQRNRKIGSGKVRYLNCDNKKSNFEYLRYMLQPFGIIHQRLNLSLHIYFTRRTQPMGARACRHHQMRKNGFHATSHKCPSGSAK